MCAPAHSAPPPTRRVGGLHGCAKSWYIAELFRAHSKIVVLCKDREESENLAGDLSFFLGEDQVLPFPAWDSLPFEHVSPQSYITAQRLMTLFEAARRAAFVAVLPVDAALQKVLPGEYTAALTFDLQPGAFASVEEISAKLIAAGYQKVSLVEEVGETAVRGAVIDFYPASSSAPVRIEFEHAHIARLRYFDADSQRTYADAPGMRVLPAREIVPLPGNAALLAQVRGKLTQRGKDLDVPVREMEKLLEALGTTADLPGLELFLPIALAPYAPVLSFFPPEAHIVVLDDIGAMQAAADFAKIAAEREARLKDDHYLIPDAAELYLTPAQLKQSLAARPRTYLDALGVSKGSAVKSAPKKPFSCTTLSLIELTTKLKTKVGSGDAFMPLLEAIDKWRAHDFHLAFAVGSHSRAERLQRILLDLGIDARLLDGAAQYWIRSGARYPVVILLGHLSSGVQLIDEKLVFIAENEVFSERSYRRSKVSRTSLKRLLSSLAQLTENDYLVHADYGIGIYHGLKHLEVEGAESDFLHIEYADSALYLPVQNIGKVQKFVAAEGQTPALDKLGSNRWVKTKEKIKQSVLPLAGDLIKLYAARSVAKGWRYDPYGADDENFADEFPYNETPDQRKAIEDTLGDMALEKPMDRLVCGDVGFGKTEVALRAAYKAIQHRKQVAVLAPTTLLVEQHLATFSNRFNGYPISVRALSRFHSAEQNKQTLEELARGDLDIVIGTHRLLQRDVLIKDLGLVVVDEEHRFGVKQKEQLKALKKQVDVLTLTATPIPRTLHMSLLGIRDISIISTPPVDRRLIRTYIATYDDALVRDAVSREIHRGGQCFYVHNRVQTISAVCAKLSALVPEARFRFAHGQMSERELEHIMRDYLARKIDVLVSTTIIESGIDIPNSNTIIIERADTYGLAQLYQLRGRVGRSDKQAYAYFIIPKVAKLGADAQKRLKALQSLDDLGLGFNLAIRDLEIRGAGNLLGKEQSGNVLAVGFELYSKILQEAVLHIKGEELELEETIDPEVKLGLNAFIPEWFIPDISERLVLYQRLSSARTSADLDELALEIKDRFGPLIQEVLDLVEVMRLRAVLRHYGVVRAELKNLTWHLALSSRARLDAAKILELTAAAPKKFKFGKNLTLAISFEKLSSPTQVYAEVARMLRKVER